MNDAKTYKKNERVFIKTLEHPKPIRVEIVDDKNEIIRFVHIENRWRSEVRVVQSQSKIVFVVQHLAAIKIREQEWEKKKPAVQMIVVGIITIVLTFLINYILNK